MFEVEDERLLFDAAGKTKGVPSGKNGAGGEARGGAAQAAGTLGKYNSCASQL